MNSELGEDPLSMVARCVAADVQRSCNRVVRLPLGEKHSHLYLPSGQTIPLLKVGRVTGGSVAIGGTPTNFLELISQGTHLMKRGAKLLKQLLAVSP